MNDQMPAPTILIVEDQPANMLLARAALERGGYRTLEATNAEQARACLAAARPAMILMDIGLPGQDGLSLTRELKAAPETADIPIVVLTAHAMRADEERARAAGADGYLAKPFSPRNLVALVREILENAATRRTLDRPGT